MSLRKADTISSSRGLPNPASPVQEMVRWLKQAEEDDREFGEIQPSTLEKFFVALRALTTLEAVSRETMYSIIKLVNHHLENVLRERVFEFESPVLHFIKLFKNTPLNLIPASFFSMVNTVAITLMVVSKKDLQKIRFFVNFWMEKIEIDVMEETDYDYPKYLLRSSLCNILIELAEYNDCLKHCNFNIKEISADIKNKHSLGHSFETEKARILILSILYKVDCLVFLEQSSEFLCMELISKCRLLMNKYHLQEDSKLKEVLERKSKMIENAEDKKSKSSVATGKSNKSANLSVSHRGDGTRQFIVKSQKKHISNKMFASQTYATGVGRRHWNGTESSELTPRNHFTTQDGTKKPIIKERSPKNVFFATKPKPRSDFEQQNQFSAMADRVTNSRGFSERAQEKPKGILRKNTGTDVDKKTVEADAVATKSLKRNFNSEIDRLLQISEFIQKEIKGLESEAIHKFKDQGEDSDELDKAIFEKYSALLKSKQELDLLKRNLDERIERFEKIEKNFEKTTADDSNSIQLLQTPKNAFSKPRAEIPDKSVGNRSERSIPGGQEPSIGLRLQKQASNPPIFSQKLAHLPTTGKELSHNPSSNSTLSGRHQRPNQDYRATAQSTLSWCLSAFTSPNNEQSSASRLLMKTAGASEVFEVEYVLTPRHKTRPASLVIRVFRNDSDWKGEILAEEVMAEEMVGYVFGRLNPLEVVPSHIPVSCFRDLTPFVQYVLHRYVSVELEEGTYKVSIDDRPVSLVPVEFRQKFFGIDHDVQPPLFSCHSNIHYNLD